MISKQIDTPFAILTSEVEKAIQFVKGGKTSSIYNISVRLNKLFTS